MVWEDGTCRRSGSVGTGRPRADWTGPVNMTVMNVRLIDNSKAWGRRSNVIDQSIQSS